MTQKQIRRRREVIDEDILELLMQTNRLNKELADLKKQCAHSSRAEFQYYGWKKAERCDDCGEYFFYQ